MEILSPTSGLSQDQIHSLGSALLSSLIPPPSHPHPVFSPHFLSPGSPSDTTKVIGAVGGSVTFRSPSTDGNSAMWSFGNVPIVTVLFGDPPQFIFLKEEYKTHFTVSESGRALSISQLSTEDSGIYSANIHGKIFTFTLLVYRELPEPRVTCEAQDCSDTPSDCGDRIGITVGVVVAVVMGMIICFFLFSFCKSKGLGLGMDQFGPVLGLGMDQFGPALGLGMDQFGPGLGLAMDQFGPVLGLALDQSGPALGQWGPRDRQ
ncbi:hypothetical protein HGM15179_020706 [Zosterops borbonicus]|uniref:Immunoglobulin subtype domain-containing protein n=1 Tax=Zosterops borbonicus TaxID=364589 RepID=A0A8K1D8Q2_9PASS|nr:hypothetical protein HGM15179_020706 [Zosterops borbonicus]